MFASENPWQGGPNIKPSTLPNLEKSSIVCASFCKTSVLGKFALKLSHASFIISIAQVVSKPTFLHPKSNPPKPQQIDPIFIFFSFILFNLSEIF